MAASKFTAERRADLLERFEAGLSVEDAARACDVRAGTLKSWLTRGRRESSGAHAEFAQDVDAARERARAAASAPLTLDEFREHLATAVRAGSVTAMRLWWDTHGQGKELSGQLRRLGIADPFAEPDEPDQFAELDAFDEQQRQRPRR